tara:strand:+ start:544 stop:951 length:408 start_codon:yes stop_codon:yes gene_type:complete
MSVIVTDTGFAADDFDGDFVALGDVALEVPGAVDVPSDAEPDAVRTVMQAPMIRIAFHSFSDGRGFTLAAILRRAGYQGRLRACGHVIADQYAMARRSGFDEVEISDDLAARQPEPQWLARADWQAHDYQARMRG